MDDETKKKEAEMVIRAIVEALETLEEKGMGNANGFANGDSALSQRLREKVGDLIGSRVLGLERPRLVKAIMDA